MVKYHNVSKRRNNIRPLGYKRVDSKLAMWKGVTQYERYNVLLSEFTTLNSKKQLSCSRNDNSFSRKELNRMCKVCRELRSMRTRFTGLPSATSAIWVKEPPPLIHYVSSSCLKDRNDAIVEVRKLIGVYQNASKYGEIDRSTIFSTRVKIIRLMLDFELCSQSEILSVCFDCDLVLSYLERLG